MILLMILLITDQLNNVQRVSTRLLYCNLLSDGNPCDQPVLILHPSHDDICKP